MRNATLVMIAILSIGMEALHAAPPKNPPPDVGPGRVAWFDITSTNLSRSKEFYRKLFGWEYAPVQGTDQAVEIVATDLPIGTLRKEAGKPTMSTGVVYVQVTDIRASCKLAIDLGGSIVDGFPFNLPDGIGAIALVVDPVGHPVGMYSRTPLPPDPPPAK